MCPGLKADFFTDSLGEAMAPVQAREMLRDVGDGVWMDELFVGADVICALALDP